MTCLKKDRIYYSRYDNKRQFKLDFIDDSMFLFFRKPFNIKKRVIGGILLYFIIFLDKKHHLSKTVSGTWHLGFNDVKFFISLFNKWVSLCSI